MDTVRAIDNIARAEAEGMDGARTPGGMHLRRESDGLHEVATRTVMILSANQLQPEADRATQIRLAAALERQITAKSSEHLTAPAVARSVLNDFYMQEAAATRMASFHGRDPLSHVANPASARSEDEPGRILARNGIQSAKILRTASKEDLAAIAGGRFDQIQSEHTRFGVSTVLGLSDTQMRTPTPRAPEVREPAPQARPFMAMPTAKGRPAISPASFGRKVSAER